MADAYQFSLGKQDLPFLDLPADANTKYVQQRAAMSQIPSKLTQLSTLRYFIITNKIDWLSVAILEKLQNWNYQQARRQTLQSDSLSGSRCDRTCVRHA